MLKIGVTGGIGSGKSVVCKIFTLLGVPIYDADREAKSLMRQNKIRNSLEAIFGKDIYDANGNVDRKKLSDIVFHDKMKLNQLNAIVHPEVQKHFQQWLALYHDHKYIIKEAAILFESGSYKDLDFIITVVAPVELRINRVRQRDEMSREEVERVINNQMNDEEKIKLSRFVIHNDENELVVPQVLKIHEELSTSIDPKDQLVKNNANV